jgi:hypothetical protein
VILDGKLPNIRSYTVKIYGSGQPYSYLLLDLFLNEKIVLKKLITPSAKWSFALTLFTQLCARVKLVVCSYSLHTAVCTCKMALCSYSLNTAVRSCKSGPLLLLSPHSCMHLQIGRLLLLSPHSCVLVQKWPFALTLFTQLRAGAGGCHHSTRTQHD